MARLDALQLLTAEVQRSDLFPAGAPVAMKAAPGRLDVLGALGADSGGTVAQMALPAKVAVAVQLRDEPVLLAQSEQISPPVGQSIVQFSLGEADLSPGSLVAMASGSRGWVLPLLAACAELQARGVIKGGVHLVVRGEVPMGAGQASSTAMLVAFLLALQELTSFQMEPPEMALLVRKCEMIGEAMPGGRGGRVGGEGGWGGEGTGHILDALTCLLAMPEGILRYSTQPYRLVGTVPVPADVRVLSLDTGVRYTSAHETLEELRIAGMMGLRIIETIYRDLGQTHTPLHGYLANTSPLLYRQYFRMLLPKRMRAVDFVRTYGAGGVLPEGMGNVDAGKLYRVRTAVDHLIAEHEHAEQFLQAMEELADLSVEEDGAERQKILQRAGRLALASHHSYRLRLELSCREADWLVDRLMEAGPERGIYGARITGCGGGGTVMALVDKSSAAGEAVLEVMSGYQQVTGLALGVSEAGASGGLSH